MRTITIPLDSTATRRRIVADGCTISVVSTDGDFYIGSEPSGDMILMQRRGDSLDFKQPFRELYYTVDTAVADGEAVLLVSDSVGARFNPLA